MRALLGTEAYWRTSELYIPNGLSKSTACVFSHTPEQITLTDLTVRARRYEGERGGSCTLNTPTLCIISSLSTSPMIAMPFWGAGLLFVFGKFTGRRKKFFFWHWHLLFDQKPGFSLTTKNIWRNISVWRACISFLMCTAYLPRAVRP